MVPQSGYYSGNPAGAMIPVQYGSAYAPGPFAVGPYGANPYGTEPFTGLPYSDKSKTAAGLLQIFLGGLGVGRFYMGDVGIGVAQLLVTVFTLGFGALWGFVDGIIILAGRPLDNEGRPLHP